MKALPLACALLLTCKLHGNILPLLDLGPQTIQEFEKYIAKWEAGSESQFATTGRMWIDSERGGHRKDFDASKPISELKIGSNIDGGHIHHLFGTMRVPNVSLEAVLKIIENYARYHEYFRPDVTLSSATLQPDSSDRERHFRIHMELAQSTMWFDIALLGNYDARYRKLDEKRVTTLSRSISLREYKDAHNRALGIFPEGHDHGLLWRTFTVWHIRERSGGVDMEVNNISLTRPIPLPLSWWANKKARESIEKMIFRTRAAIVSSKTL